jgi:Protein of unknown function (DUF1329)
MKAVVLSILVVLLIQCCMVTGSEPAAAEFKLSFTNQGIPPGTQINLNNWQKYQQFMPYGMQTLFAGLYSWRIQPGDAIEIGPTQSIRLPSKYRSDTEQYSQSVKLRQLPNGGYALEGYVAGQPFPRPSGPLMPVQLIYNFWYQYRPFLQHGMSNGLTVDKYNNQTSSTVVSNNWKLTHISEPGLPITSPYAKGIYNSAFNEVLIPEQSKYTVALTLVPDDVTRPQENYVFVPSLRRSLRLSASARCAPLLGSDYTADDLSYFNGSIPDFDYKLLGEGNFLTMVHFTGPPIADAGVEDFPKYVYPVSYWPRPYVGKFEVRDTYVMEITPKVGVLGGNYCYSKRLLYIDKETMVGIWMDLWDHGGKFWKTAIQACRPTRVPGGEPGDVGLAQPSGPWALLWDVESHHLTVSAPYQSYTVFNSDAPEHVFNNVDLFATPAGLLQVMQ